MVLSGEKPSATARAASAPTARRRRRQLSERRARRGISRWRRGKVTVQATKGRGWAGGGRRPAKRTRTAAGATTQHSRAPRRTPPNPAPAGVCWAAAAQLIIILRFSHAATAPLPAFALSGRRPPQRLGVLAHLSIVARGGCTVWVLVAVPPPPRECERRRGRAVALLLMGGRRGAKARPRPTEKV